MKTLEVKSKKHGVFNVLLDDEDYEKTTKTWKTAKWCVRKCENRQGLFYFQKRIAMGKGGLIELHRFIMGFPKDKVVDHINGNTLDNRKENLRVCTNRSNIRKGKIRVNNTSGYTGIYINKKQNTTNYQAKIRVNYEWIKLGWFNSFDDAVEARKKAEVLYYEV